MRQSNYRSQLHCALESLEARQLYANVTIAVNQSQTFQTSTYGSGGDYARGNSAGSASGLSSTTGNDAVGDYNLSHMKVRIARVGIPLREWSPTSISSTVYNNASSAANYSYFATTDPTVVKALAIMKTLSNDGYATKLYASVWDAPNWMVSNTTATHGRTLYASKYNAYAYALASFIKYAQSQGCGTILAVAPNECNNRGNDLLFTGTQQGDLIADEVPRFSANGLTTKFAVGETDSVNPSASYLPDIYAELAVKGVSNSALGPVTFHAWGSLNDEDHDDYSVWNEFATLAAQHGQQVYVTELGFDANYQDNSQIGWANALQYAKLYYKSYAWANASSAFYWELQNDYPTIDANQNPYDVFYVVKQFTDDLETQDQRVAATASGDIGSDPAMRTVLPVAWKNANGDFKLDIVDTNADGFHTSLTVTGLPNKAMSWIRTNAVDHEKVISSVTPVNGTVTLDMYGSSVYSLEAIANPFTPSASKLMATSAQPLNTSSTANAASGAAQLSERGVISQVDGRQTQQDPPLLRDGDGDWIDVVLRRHNR